MTYAATGIQMADQATQSEIQTTPAYPTETRVRQKEEAKLRAAAGLEKKEVVKRRQDIEKGTDDCGEDQSSLDFLDSIPDELIDSHFSADAAQEFIFHCTLEENEFLEHLEGDLNPKYWLAGSAVTGIPFEDENLTYFPTFQAFMHEYYKAANRSFVDVFELCGGNNRVSTVLMKRRHAQKIDIGINFDIVVGLDLMDPETLTAFWGYIQWSKPLVGILSTPCTGLSGFSALNALINPEGWNRSRLISLPLGDLAGTVAQYQLNGHRHFLSESPRGSELYDLPSGSQLRTTAEQSGPSYTNA
jgi:hypothetical protein